MTLDMIYRISMEVKDELSATAKETKEALVKLSKTTEATTVDQAKKMEEVHGLLNKLASGMDESRGEYADLKATVAGVDGFSFV